MGRSRKSTIHQFLDPSGIAKIEEPINEATVITQEEFIGEDFQAPGREARHPEEIRTRGGNHVMLVYEMPLNEIVLDFFDR